MAVIVHKGVANHESEIQMLGRLRSSASGLCFVGLAGLELRVCGVLRYLLGGGGACWMK